MKNMRWKNIRDRLWNMRYLYYIAVAIVSFVIILFYVVKSNIPFIVKGLIILRLSLQLVYGTGKDSDKLLDYL